MNQRKITAALGVMFLTVMSMAVATAVFRVQPASAIGAPQGKLGCQKTGAGSWSCDTQTDLTVMDAGSWQTVFSVTNPITAFQTHEQLDITALVRFRAAPGGDASTMGAFQLRRMDGQFENGVFTGFGGDASDTLAAAGMGSQWQDSGAQLVQCTTFGQTECVQVFCERPCQISLSTSYDINLVGDTGPLPDVEAGADTSDSNVADAADAADSAPPPPTMASLAPIAQATGSYIQLRGTNMTSLTACAVNGNASTISSATSSTALCLVPTDATYSTNGSGATTVNVTTTPATSTLTAYYLPSSVTHLYSGDIGVSTTSWIDQIAGVNNVNLGVPGQCFAPGIQGNPNGGALEAGIANTDGGTICMSAALYPDGGSTVPFDSLFIASSTAMAGSSPQPLLLGQTVADGGLVPDGGTYGNDVWLIATDGVSAQMDMLNGSVTQTSIGSLPTTAAAFSATAHFATSSGNTIWEGTATNGAVTNSSTPIFGYQILGGSLTFGGGGTFSKLSGGIYWIYISVSETPTQLTNARATQKAIGLTL